MDNLETLEAIKKMILIKKRPNRRQLPKENAVIGKRTGATCIHYTGGTTARNQKIGERLTRVYDITDWSMRCSGCSTPGCYTKLCDPLKCAQERGQTDCASCVEYPCASATAGYARLEPRHILADDVTWAILPYVPYQYGN